MNFRFDSYHIGDIDRSRGINGHLFLVITFCGIIKFRVNVCNKDTNTSESKRGYFSRVDVLFSRTTNIYY